MKDADLQVMLAKAKQAQRQGATTEAARLHRAIIAAVGDHPLSLNALGMQALASGDAAAAAGLFTRAISADPNAPELWMNLARACRDRHDDDGERRALDGALALDRVHFMALVRQAELFDRTGEAERAAERWGGLLTLAAAMPAAREGDLAPLLAHARSRVAAHRDRFAAIVDEGLAVSRAEIDPAGRRRFDACMDHALGRRAIHTNECAGLHFPFLPADEFFERHHFPWLAMLEAQTPVIQAELMTLLSTDGNAIRPYVMMELGTPANKWSRLDRSLDWGALHLWRDGRRDEAACALAPRTAAIVEALPLSDMPGRTPTVFFSLLRPGAHLPAHTGVSNVRTIIHLPLIAPPGCRFRVGGETREWVEGHAWAFDDTIEHEAWNESAETRAVLIFDIWNPYLTATERDLLRRFYAISDATDGITPPRVAD